MICIHKDIVTPSWGERSMPSNPSIHMYCTLLLLQILQLINHKAGYTLKILEGRKSRSRPFSDDPWCLFVIRIGMTDADRWQKSVSSFFSLCWVLELKNCLCRCIKGSPDQATDHSRNDQWFDIITYGTMAVRIKVVVKSWVHGTIY